MSIIGYSGVAVVKIYSKNTTVLTLGLYTMSGLTGFVFLPRLWEVVKGKRVSNVFIALEKERKAKLISTI